MKMTYFPQIVIVSLFALPVIHADGKTMKHEFINRKIMCKQEFRSRIWYGQSVDLFFKFKDKDMQF